ncbi:DNA-directed RNA polymerase III, subunit Rpc31 [Massariosphaeria phaeospora]|uniref:DNA-directed RNA polymerase III subunit n=1 Tax=Massariosphaeria phaeospora TaxID=100035 RepID=A0A7C8I6E9_9PLEO|nr:DNA-directed RNA polymerase III, subunit Rpc31 [Massariosphaeria phaeospora]
MAPGRGRGGGGGFSARPGTVNIGGVELAWDISGLGEIKKTPAERFPKRDPPLAPPATPAERATVQHMLAARDRMHEGPFYTILGDGRKNGLKRKANEPAPTETSLFNPFTDNHTYTSKYFKVRRRAPKLDTHPFVVEFFPEELRSVLGNQDNAANDPNQKRKVLTVTKHSAMTAIDRMIKTEEGRTEQAARDEDEADEEADEEELAEDEDKPDAVEEDDNWSAVSTDSEESGDDYNAEQYFDNGEDDDIDDADPYENTYE